MSLHPRAKAGCLLLLLLGVVVALAFLFPPVLAFVEMASRELRYLWWLVLLVALAIWLIWGIGRKPKP
jgi:hypothetical protein